MKRIHKRSPLPVPDHVAQAIYRGRLMLSNWLVYDTEDGEWYDWDSWPPKRETEI